MNQRIVCLLLFILAINFHIHAEEVINVQSVNYEIIQWSAPNNNQNKWKVKFTTNEGQTFSFEAPTDISGEIFPLDVVYVGSQLVVKKERRLVNGSSQSWVIFENRETHQQFKAFGDAIAPVPFIEGEDVYIITDINFHNDSDPIEDLRNRNTLYIQNPTGSFLITTEVNDFQFNDYFKGLPLLLLEELDPIQAEWGYQKQFKFYHPLLEDEVILTTKPMQGSPIFKIEYINKTEVGRPRANPMTYQVQVAYLIDISLNNKNSYRICFDYLAWVSTGHIHDFIPSWDLPTNIELADNLIFLSEKLIDKANHNAEFEVKVERTNEILKIHGPALNLIFQ